MHRTRYRRIVFFFARSLLGFIFWDLALPRIGLRALSRRTRPERMRRFAGSFRSLAVEMGGVLIKVGQFFSARVDVLPQEITDELSGLQDEVQPEPFSALLPVLEEELGQAARGRFADFEELPLAAASLGQVHRARLQAEDALEGSLRDVVVKIQRPGIEAILATDLAAIRRVGNWLKRYPPIRRRADVDALLAEFTRILYEEIDYLAEGRNAETFAKQFASETGVQVPRVVWSLTTRRVLTLEDVYAIKITDFAAISAAGIDRAEVARRLFETYLTQIFEDGFFHADPHPGNLFVTPLENEAEREDRRWALTFVDFGMVGRIPFHLRAGLRELVIGIGTRDPDRTIRAYQKLGVLLPGADLEMIRRAETAAFDRFWGKSMQELQEISFEEMSTFTREFRQLLYNMPFQVPQDLILLGRTVGILSGLCTGLDPRFNVWEGLAPFAEKLVAEELTRDWSYWLGELADQARLMWGMPRRLDSLLDTLDRGALQVRSGEITGGIRRLERAVHRLVAGLVFAALVVSGVQLYLAQELLLAAVLSLGAILTLIWLMLR